MVREESTQEPIWLRNKSNLLCLCSVKVIIFSWVLGQGLVLWDFVSRAAEMLSYNGLLVLVCRV